MIESDTSTPLLPSFTADRMQPPNPAVPGRRPVSPLLSSSAMIANGSIGSRAIAGLPQMWDGSMGPDGNLDKAKERDLTNTKLAKNQLVRLTFALAYFG